MLILMSGNTEQFPQLRKHCWKENTFFSQESWEKQYLIIITETFHIRSLRFSFKIIRIKKNKRRGGGFTHHQFQSSTPWGRLSSMEYRAA